MTLRLAGHFYQHRGDSVDNKERLKRRRAVLKSLNMDDKDSDIVKKSISDTDEEINEHDEKQRRMAAEEEIQRKLSKATRDAIRAKQKRLN